jgi:hypothetical protein
VDGDEGGRAPRVGELGRIGQRHVGFVVQACHCDIDVEITLERSASTPAELERELLLLQTVRDGSGITTSVAGVEDDELWHPLPPSCARPGDANELGHRHMRDFCRAPEEVTRSSDIVGM